MSVMAKMGHRGSVVGWNRHFWRYVWFTESRIFRLHLDTLNNWIISHWAHFQSETKSGPFLVSRAKAPPPPYVFRTRKYETRRKGTPCRKKSSPPPSVKSKLGAPLSNMIPVWDKMTYRLTSYFAKATWCFTSTVRVSKPRNTGSLQSFAVCRPRHRFFMNLIEKLPCTLVFDRFPPDTSRWSHRSGSWRPIWRSARSLCRCRRAWAHPPRSRSPANSGCPVSRHWRPKKKKSHEYA